MTTTEMAGRLDARLALANGPVEPTQHSGVELVTLERDGGAAVGLEVRAHLRALTHDGELVAHRLVHQRGRDRGVDAAGEPADDALVADLRADLVDRVLDDRHVGPGRSAARRVEQEPSDRGHPVLGVGHLGVELDAIGPPSKAEGLVLEGLAGGQEFRRPRQAEAFPVPVIDMVGPRPIGRPRRRRRDRIVADLDLAIWMGRDGSAQAFGQHLGAEADAEERDVGFDAGDEGFADVHRVERTRDRQVGCDRSLKKLKRQRVKKGSI